MKARRIALQLFAVGMAAGLNANDLPSRSPEVAAEAPSHFTNWQTQEGLPSNKVMAVLQARDGYLWIGTYEGLIRFDGVKFTLFDSNVVPALHDISVTSLFESADGTLWIGHSTGAVTTMKAGVFTTYPVRSTWKASRIRSIGADGSGDVWVWDDAGELARMRDGLVLKPVEGSAPSVREMAVTADGRIWVTSRGVLSVLHEGKLSVVPLLPEMDNYVQGICAARAGGIWVVSQGGLWRWSGEAWGERLGDLSLGESPLQTFLEKKDGRLIAGTSDQGAIVIRPEPFGEVRLSRATGFPSNWVVAVTEDHEGGLWIGSGGSGLFRSREEVVQTLVAPDAWQGRLVLSVTSAAKGGFWVSTEGAGLYWFDGERWTNYARDAGLRNPYIWSVQETADGVLWMGMASGGLYSESGGEFTRAPGMDPYMTSITAIIPAQEGGLWAGSYAGVLRYADGVAHWVEPAAGRQLRRVRALLQEADGVLWIGSNGDGLGRLEQGTLRRFTKKDGLGSDFVQSLYQDAAGTLWIGTRGAGLSRLKNGRFSTVGLAQGLTDSPISHIVEDGRGFVWMSTHAGILRVNKAELERCADGQLPDVNCQTYGVSDGMLTLSCSGGLQPAGFTMPDGKLVFSTDRGPAVIDPANLKLNPRPPPVRVESVRAGDRVFAEGLAEGAVVKIAAGQSRIEIKYTGLSFAAPEKVRFKRQLVGLESDWVDVGRERQAVYNYVPPGEYRFRVIACNNDNVWSESPTSVTLVVLPFFWQTAWFQSLIVAALLAMTAAAVWLQARARFRRALEGAERERAIEVERSRIANDMHDDLGSHLTRITMLSETARSDIGDSTKVQAGLGQIYDTARNVTRAMDEIVWAVNPKHDTLESLVYYLEKFALELLGTAGIRSRLEMPAELPVWNPRSEVRHNLFLAVKEALNNAVRHSAADTVTITMELEGQVCRLTIADNGRGILPPQESGYSRDRVSGGNGVTNMRERMGRIGGVCEITSVAGRGTVVLLSVPREGSGIRKFPLLPGGPLS